jgi:ATP-binding cassette, subfamily B, bacterial
MSGRGPVSNTVLWKTLWRAICLVWQSGPVWTIAVIALMVPQSILPLALLYVMKLIIDSVNFGVVHGDMTYDKIAMLLVLAVSIEVISILSQSIGAMASNFQSALVSDHVQEVIHAKSVAVDMEYYDSPKYYDRLHMVQQEAPFRPVYMTNSLAQLLQNIIILISTSLLILRSPGGITCFLILLITSLPGAVINKLNSEKMYRWQLARTEPERRAWYNHWILTDRAYAKELRLFDLGSFFKANYTAVRQQLRASQMDFLVKRSTIVIAARFLEVIAIYVSFMIITIKGLSGEITLGDITMYYGVLRQVQESLDNLESGLVDLNENRLFMTALYEFLDMESHLKAPAKPTEVPKPLRHGIKFENVSFSYPGTDRLAIQNINMHLKPSEVVLLVGKNGSGKSTIIKLLCRLYDPQSGRITIDGIDIRDTNLSDLRHEISYILQDYNQYNLTLAENIWLGDIRASPEARKIEESAERSGAGTFLKRLEYGYETRLGKWFDKGTDLSTGEWQKVALARMFYRDAQIFIMDEPTSSLDPNAESEVLLKIKELSEKKIVIIISHRLAVAKIASCIYLLDNGRIKEEGTHQELVDHNDEYAQIFKTLGSLR